VLVDRDGKAAEEYGVIVLPSTGIIGSDGILTFYLPSRSARYREIIEGRLQLLLGEVTAKELEDRLGRLGGPPGTARERARAHYASAHRFSAEARWAEAAAELQEALKLAPDFIDARLQLGYAYLESGQPEKGLKEFEAVLTQSPGSPGAKMGVGIARLRLGDLQAGIAQLEAAVALNPNPVRGYYELGLAYERTGEFHKALHNYKWAIKKLLQGRM
jgi:tetratricopeptide (TPR) repeat protein